jgi:hypothetical protein
LIIYILYKQPNKDLSTRFSEKKLNILYQFDVMASYENKDPIDLAKQAEADLNSHALKHGVHNTSDSGMRLSFFYLRHSLSCLWLACLLAFPGFRDANAVQDADMMPQQTAAESGVNQGVETKFPGASVTYGSAASGAGDNREIPVEEGGDIGANGK